MNAILRRSYKGENPIVKLSGSEIDFDRAEVIKNGEHIALTAKEHDILVALYRNAGALLHLMPYAKRLGATIRMGMKTL